MLQHERCVAILCQEYNHPRFDICVAVGSVLAIPVFATFQGAHRPDSRLELPIRALTMRRAAGFLVGPKAERVRFRQRSGIAGTKIAALGNPIDTNYWQSVDKESARSRLDIDQGVRVVAWHGRVEIDIKGLDLLLQAWEQVLASTGSEKAQLHLLGDGRDARQFAQLVARIRPGTVAWRQRFTTRADEVRDFLSAADVYVMPSRSEGSPIAILEAMSCGLPAVATHTANASEILKAPGAQIAGAEVASAPKPLAAALKRFVLDKDLSRQAGCQGRQQVTSRFDLEVFGPQLAKFLFERASGGLRS